MTGRAPRRASVAMALAVLSLVLVACSSPPEPKPYIYHPDTSPIDVDTPALRAQKAAAGIAACPKSEPADTSTEGGLPPITLPCLGGGRDVNLAGLSAAAGTPLVINVWANDCAPCRKESPILQRVAEATAGRVGFIGIDWQDTHPGAAIAFAQEFGVTYPQLADPTGEIKSQLRFFGLPATFLVDASGQIVHAELRAVTSEEQFGGLISKYLHVEVPAAGAR